MRRFHFALNALALGLSLGAGSPFAALRDVVINEVSWMGTSYSTADEWIELKNTTLAGTSSSAWATALANYDGGKGTPKAANSTVDDGSGGDPGCAYPHSLEISSINIGQGDAAVIATPSKLLLADAGESNWNSHKDADKIATEIQARYGTGCNTLDYVVISHIHLDHIGYIAADEDGSKTYRNWRAYLESPDGIADFHPETAVLGDFNMWVGGDASGENYDSQWGYRYRDDFLGRGQQHLRPRRPGRSRSGPCQEP